MNIAPRYLGRGSWLARRDPRVLILVVALFIFTVLQVWDERIVLLLLAIAIVYYRSAGIKWVSGYPENFKRGLPYISGLMIMNDSETGVPYSVMDCSWITAMRTGAA